MVKIPSPQRLDRRPLAQFRKEKYPSNFRLMTAGAAPGAIR
jgi:hypothetical protein